MVLVVGFTIYSIMNTTQTLVIDLVPGRSSSVTACVSVNMLPCLHLI